MNNNTPIKNDARKAPLGGELDFATKEAYNLLRTNLTYTLPVHNIYTDPQPNNKGYVIGITSSVPGEGKSYTSVNLAYTMAEAGYSVLLIEGDMRKPSIDKMLDKKMAPGLSNLLVKNANNVIHKGLLHDNMDVILSGDIPPNPSELLGSPQMKNLVEVFSTRYTYTIIDLPPVTAVSDPLIISQLLDGVILVTRHNTSRRREITDSVRQLKMVNAKILGLVYNGFTNGGYKHGYNKYNHYYN